VNILKQVEELRDIASDFSIYSRIPRAELVTGDLVAAMKELLDAYHAASRETVSLRFEADVEKLSTRFDPKLLGRAVRNLLENALRATAGKADGEGSVRLRVERLSGEARISVFDSGPGVEPESLTRIFDPYFSTHETGTGLGLAISKRIVEEHAGHLEARNRPGGGLEVTITIPLVK
jgi:two-component system nitrogen regulation sensor histidine kinase NtrY